MGQGCLDGYNRFQTQEEIDAFAIMNPDCSTIQGDLVIWESSDGAITNLDAFKNLQQVDGFLQVRSTSSLSSLDGLSNINTVGGQLYLQGNDALADFAGLNSLTEIGGDLFIGQHNSLTSLRGLDGLESIGGYLNIRNNSALKDIKALRRLMSIGSFLNIQENDDLTTLLGLQNLDPSSITTDSPGTRALSIFGNASLSYCNSPMLCMFLSLPDADYRINGNGGNCSSADDIVAMCTPATTCNTGGNVFDTQSEIDEFPFRYYGCSVVSGDIQVEESTLSTILDVDGFYDIVEVNGSLSLRTNFALDNISGLAKLSTVENSLIISFAPALRSVEPLAQLESVEYFQLSQTSIVSNLNGLEGLTAVDKTLTIRSNSDLQSLTGLDNLQSVGLDLDISNNSRLKDLTGLGSLTTIERELEVSTNDSLVSLQGLTSLASIGDELYLYNNRALTDLTGLESIDLIGGRLEIRENTGLENLSGLNPFTSVGNLSLLIWGNANLDMCGSQAICNIIAAEGFRDIRDNASGCNSEDEVFIDCLSSSASDLPVVEAVLTPNPATSHIKIESRGKAIDVLSIYDVEGRLIYTTSQLGGVTAHIVPLDHFQKGVFFAYIVDSHGGIHRSKFVKL